MATYNDVSIDGRIGPFHNPEPDEDFEDCEDFEPDPDEEYERQLENSRRLTERFG